MEKNSYSQMCGSSLYYDSAPLRHGELPYDIVL